MLLVVYSVHNHLASEHLEGHSCWPKGTSSSFVLMITNHMKLFGTNQVQVFKLFKFKGYFIVLFLKRKVFKSQFTQGWDSSSDDRD